MKIFATINKPYTIIVTQLRVLGVFSLSENVCNQATNKLPAFYSKGMPIKCTIVSPLPPFS